MAIVGDVVLWLVMFCMMHIKHVSAQKDNDLYINSIFRISKETNLSLNSYCKSSALRRLRIKLVIVTSQNSGTPMRRKEGSQQTQPSLGLDPEIKTWFVFAKFKS